MLSKVRKLDSSPTTVDRDFKKRKLDETSVSLKRSKSKNKDDEFYDNLNKNYYDNNISSNQLDSLKDITEKRILSNIDDLNNEKLTVLEEIEHLEHGLSLSTWNKNIEMESNESNIPLPQRSNVSSSNYANLSFAELENRKTDLRRQIEIIQRECGRKLPKGPEPPRNKVHWDYLLEEMTWMSNDFKLERRWKVVLARKIVRAVIHYHATKEAAAIRKVKLLEQHQKRLAAFVSREIKKFWLKIDSVINVKRTELRAIAQQSELNKQFELLVGKTEEYSAQLAQGLNSNDQDKSSGSFDQQTALALASIEGVAKPDGNTFSSHHVKVVAPHLLRFGSLREYQHIGLDWLVTMHQHNLNGILADEMGLGKTIMAISLLAHLACVEHNWGPHLIIVPTSVMINWEVEFKRWAPAFKILCYHGNRKERDLKRKGWSQPDSFHVCITSYKLVVQDAAVFKRKSWQYMLLDEAHNIKNFKSQRWQTLLSFKTQHRLLLTGTPLQNNLMELWSLMHFLMPHIFSSQREFKEWFNPVTSMIEGKERANQALIDRLHGILRPFLLRRMKADVAKQLPPKSEYVLICRLSKRQRQLYDEFMARADIKSTLASSNYLGLMNVLMQLRKVCNHPDLFAARPIFSPFIMEQISFDYPNFINIDLSNSLLDSNFSIIDESPLTPFAVSTLKQLALTSEAMEKIGTAFNLSALRTSLYPVASTFFSSHIQSKSNQLLTSIRSRINFQSVRNFRRTINGYSHYSLLPSLNIYKSVSSVAHCVKDGSIILKSMVLLPTERFQIMQELLLNFVFLTPKASTTQRSTLPINEYHYSTISALEVSSQIIAPLSIKRMLNFPDASLVQYDCGKLQRLASLLIDIKAGGHRTLIFTQMTKMLDILEVFINMHGYTYLRLDGSTKIEQRQKLMERFNTDPRILIFILSTRSGGVGINLTGADTVIFYDTDWNPAMDAQAQDRCHRIGQTRPVRIFRLISESTVEENILKKANQKRKLDSVVISEGQFTTDQLASNTASTTSVSFSNMMNPTGGVSHLRSLLTDDDTYLANENESISAEDQAAAMRAAEEKDDSLAAKRLELEQKEEMDEFQEESKPSLYGDLFSRIGSHLRKIEIYALHYSLNHLDTTALFAASSGTESLAADASCNSLLDQFDSANAAEDETLPAVNNEAEEDEIGNYRRQLKPDALALQNNRSLFYFNTFYKNDGLIEKGLLNPHFLNLKYQSVLEKRKISFDLPDIRAPKIPITDEIYVSPLDADYSKNWGLFSDTQSIQRLLSIKGFNITRRKIKLIATVPKSRLTPGLTFQHKSKPITKKINVAGVVSNPPAARYAWTSEDDSHLMKQVAFFTAPLTSIPFVTGAPPPLTPLPPMTVNWNLLAESLNATCAHNRFRSALECSERFTWLQEATLSRQLTSAELNLNEKRNACIKECETISGSEITVSVKAVEKSDNPMGTALFPSMSISNILNQMASHTRHIQRVRSDIKATIRKQTQHIDKSFVHQSHVNAFHKAVHDWGSFDKHVLLPSELLALRATRPPRTQSADKSNAVEPLLISKSQMIPSKVQNLIDVSKLIAIAPQQSSESRNANRDRAGSTAAPTTSASGSSAAITPTSPPKAPSDKEKRAIVKTEKNKASKKKEKADSISGLAHVPNIPPIIPLSAIPLPGATPVSDKKNTSVSSIPATISSLLPTAPSTPANPYTRPPKKVKTPKPDSSITDLTSSSRSVTSPPSSNPSSNLPPQATNVPKVAIPPLNPTTPTNSNPANAATQPNSSMALRMVVQQRPEIKQALYELLQRRELNQQEKVDQIAKLIRESSASNAQSPPSTSESNTNRNP